MLQYAVDSWDPYPVKLTASTFEHVTNLVDVLGPVMAFKTSIWADTIPVRWSLLATLLRLTNTMIITPAAGKFGVEELRGWGLSF